MPTLPTFNELYDVAKAEVQSRRSDLVDFTEGSTLDAIAGAGAALADEIIRINVGLFATLFFDTAVDAELDTLAADRFGPIGARKVATPALGTVTWTRGAAGAYTIPAGTRISGQVADETVTVITTSSVSMGALDTTKSIPVRAQVTGRSGNVVAGVLDTIVDFPSADTTATVTNAAALAGGTEGEGDEAYRARLRLLWSTLRRGTADALKTGALLVDGVTVVSVHEEATYVEVVIGDPDGNGSAPLVAAVETELENWRAAGVLVSVLAAEREVIPIALTVYVERGSDLAALEEACAAAIEAYGDSLAPGVAAQRSRVEQACHDASELVVGVDFDSVALELVPSGNQKAIRFEAASITFTWVQVA